MAQVTDQVFDVAIIGGGINGCGCAADAALRGLSVFLVEQDDIASKTSSSSTKLVHGGLRYLEHYEFSLVKKALAERQRLLDLAPYLIHPQALVLPYQNHMRPIWLLRLGLFLYDNLSRKNRLPKCTSITRKKNSSLFAPLRASLNRGFLFYDAATDDSRLTITNAIQAARAGALIKNYSRLIHAVVSDNLWHLTIKPQSGEAYTIRAKSLINAGGPWVDLIANLTNSSPGINISLVKGSHIVVPKLYDEDHAYFLQHDDERVIFVIPYHGFSMIGTTDVPLNEPLDKVSISNEEIRYLIDTVNSYFASAISQSDIVSTWSGVRPLLPSEGTAAKALSRDYRYEARAIPAPVVTIFGGKITTYRKLAEEVIDQLKTVFPDMPKSKTKTTVLPGAIWQQMDFTRYIGYAKNKYSWLSAELLEHYLYSYGTNMELFLAPCKDISTLGKHFGALLYQVEVDYLIEHEWVMHCDDLLMRRTKFGLILDDEEKNELQRYLAKTISTQK
ncbi:MAG: glycerol-3-phosphate dehydrogenase [Legionella sp.]